MRGARCGEPVPELPALLRRPRRHRHPPPRLQARAPQILRLAPRPQGPQILHTLQKIILLFHPLGGVELSHS